jgi:cytochrome c-type biogenesis protein CcmH
VNLFVGICALLLASAIGLLLWPLVGRRKSGDARPGAPAAAAVVAAALPVAAFVIYFAVSNWDWNAPPQAPAMSARDIHQAVAQLQARLKEHPEEIEGWKLLGRSAVVLGDVPLAHTAFGEAYTRTQGQDADAVVGYAESMVLLDERAIDGEAAPLFERALELAPDNPRALWYGGVAAYRRGNMALAQQRWVKLQNYDLPDDVRQVLNQRLAELGQSGGMAAARPGPAEAPAAQAAPAGAAAINIAIGIEPGLRTRIPPNAMLFIIARRGAGGPPLAVQRHAVGSWPVQVRLSDADAMMPGVSLAAGGPVTLIARISASGQPIAASGDLFGEVGYDFSSANPANITIDRIVP